MFTFIRSHFGESNFMYDNAERLDVRDVRAIERMSMGNGSATIFLSRSAHVWSRDGYHVVVEAGRNIVSQ